MLATLMICSLVFAMTACKKDKGNDDDQNQNDQNNGQGDNGTTHVHSFTEWTTVTPATCTTAGSETRSCTASDCTHTETRTVSALGHNIKHHEAEAPECDAVGWNAYDTCTRCDYTTYSEISATGHNYTIDATLNPNGNVCVTCGQTHVCVDDNFKNWTTVDVADCTVSGKEECKCSVCNYVKENTLPKTQHSYGEDGKCSSCGAEETDVPELPDAPF